MQRKHITYKNYRSKCSKYNTYDLDVSELISTSVKEVTNLKYLTIFLLMTIFFESWNIKMVESSL